MGLFNFWKKEEKSVPAVAMISEQTREGRPKAYIPKFLYKPPFGYPRFVDIPFIRYLAGTPYVEMCITTIVDEVCSVPWDVVPKDGMTPTTETDKHIEEAKNFFSNPNTNKESFEEIRRKYLRDILEIDAGVLNKIFNMKNEMVEMVARDGATFTKNPDIYGMFTDREDIILDTAILPPNKESSVMALEPGFISSSDAREKAAYFQYGWLSGARPVPFGKKEIIWFERNPRTDDIYGRSPVQVLAETIQTLIYSIEHNLEYFNDNSIPKGVLALEGSDADEIEAFKDQWIQQQLKKDTEGNWKKSFHNLPIVNKKPDFVRFQLTNSELELLEGQKWWAKMVWACFGVTSVELGYTEDSKGLANQIVQSNVFRKRSIYPLLRLEEYKINQEIISEFEYDDIEFKFILFDVEEETKRAAFYKLQLDAGIRTINEIRQDEGLDDLEWGDKDPKENLNSGFGNNDWGNPIGNEANKKKEETTPDEKKKIDSKDFELKFKYIKRTGSPGNYRYWYRNPNTGKLEEGKKPEANPRKNLKLYPKLNNFQKREIPKGEITYNSSIKLTEDTWEFSSKEEKISLLKELGYKPDWAEMDTIRELVQRGGGIIANDLKNMNNRLLELAEGSLTISWEDRSGKNPYQEGSEAYNNYEEGHRDSTKEEKQEQDKIAEGILKIKKRIDAGENPEGLVDDLREFEINLNQSTADKINYEKIKEDILKKLNNKEQKAMTTMDNPLILRENEVLDDTRLERTIVYVLRQNEEKIKAMIEKEIGTNKLQEIKAVDDLAKAIKNILTFEGLRLISDAVIKNTFMKGWDSAEKQLNKNMIMNRDAVSFIQDYTYNNIKSMTDEILTDLRQELERGIMNGEGITAIKNRISGVFDVGENRAEMIARTETNRAENHGKIQAFKTSGEKFHKRWIAAMDDRTSPICRRMHGQEVKENENFNDNDTGWEGPCPPSHVNCRSTVIFTTD